jgi:hypothetical protein
MKALPLLSAIGWLVVLAVSVAALRQEGMSAGRVFFADIAQFAWRAQFNIDFLLHLLLFAAWVAWRHRRRRGGLVLAACCVLGGGLFSLAYLFCAVIGARGDISCLLLGENSGGSHDNHHGN